MAEEPIDSQQVTIRGGDGTPAVYANVCNVLTTPEELYLHFGQRCADNPIESTHLVAVCMSLPHAKRIASALGRVIQAYEEAFGEIAADPGERLTAAMRQKLGLPPMEEQENGC